MARAAQDSVDNEEIERASRPAVSWKVTKHFFIND